MELKTGMLWMNDENGLSVQDAIRRAFDYFTTKYGFNPNYVEVHPEDNPQNVTEVTARRGTLLEYTLGVRNSTSILRNHLLIGVME